MLVKIGMTILDAGQLPLDEKIFHLGLYFEGIAAGHNHVAKLPCFERSQLIAEAEYLPADSLRPLSQEAAELTAILVTSLKVARWGKGKG